MAIAFHDLGFEEEQFGKMDDALAFYKKGLEIARENLGVNSSLFKKFKTDFDSFTEVFLCCLKILIIRKNPLDPK
jgi:hypothetical protein